MRVYLHCFVGCLISRPILVVLYYISRRFYHCGQYRPQHVAPLKTRSVAHVTKIQMCRKRCTSEPSSIRVTSECRLFVHKTLAHWRIAKTGSVLRAADYIDMWSPIGCSEIGRRNIACVVRFTEVHIYGPIAQFTALNRNAMFDRLDDVLLILV